MDNKKDIIEELLKKFIEELNEGKQYKIIPAKAKNINVEDEYKYNIYNEISLQHELGKFLEKELGEDYKVFYEKSMYNHNEKTEEWVKKEADLVIIRKDQKEKYAIELKFSKGENARTPETLFDYIKDIRFMEVVKAKKGYTNVYNFMIANSQKYYKYELNNEKDKKYDIYKMFRIKPKDGEQKRKFNILQKPEGMEKYCKPTGKDGEKKFVLNNEYKGEWKILIKNDSGDEKGKIFQYRYIFINHNKYEQI